MTLENLKPMTDEQCQAVGFIQFLMGAMLVGIAVPVIKIYEIVFQEALNYQVVLKVNEIVPKMIVKS